MIQRTKYRLKQLLLWSQTYTHSDMVYLGRGGFWLTTGQGVVLLSSSLLSIAFANLIAPETYGTYKYILSIGSLLSAFSLSGLDESLIRYQAQTQRNVLASAWKIRFRGSVFVVVLGLIAFCYYLIAGNTDLALGILFAGIAFPFLHAFSMVQPYLEGNQNFKRQSTNKITTTLLYSSIMGVALLFRPGSLFLSFLYYVVQILIVGWLFYRVKRTDTRPTGDIGSEEIHFANHLSLMRFVGGVADQLDKIVLFHYLGAVQLALFTFALAPVDQIVSIVKLYAQKLSLPRLSLRSFETIHATLPKKTLGMIFLLIPGILLYIVVAPVLFRLVFPHYMAAVTASQLYALVILTTPTKLLSQAFVAHKIKKSLYIERLITPLFKVVLTILLIPAFGVMGGVVSILVARGFSMGITVALFLWARQQSSEAST